MTLEKLLIFGFALAALFAITTVGITMMETRAEQGQELTDETNSLKDSGGNF